MSDLVVWEGRSFALVWLGKLMESGSGLFVSFFFFFFFFLGKGKREWDWESVLEILEILDR